MLRPSKDRLDYSKLLSPPPGYETAFAVGTTYSLDLDALIGASISLALSESIDSVSKDEPIYLLTAINKIAEKILIFNEAGQIKSPNKSNKLHMFLEEMVSEILIENQGSFHPKFWLIKYENNSGNNIYRSIILSRNLTFDRSWDVAVSIEGQIEKDDPGNEIHEKSKPLSDFLKALVDLPKRNDLDNAKKEQVLALAEEILKVEFKLDQKEFRDYSFEPLGIPGYPIEHTNLFTTYNELFMITPFLSAGIIEKFNSLALTNKNFNTLITRKSELYKLDQEKTSKFNVYTLKDTIVDGENLISEYDKNEELTAIQSQDIHAKVYLKTKKSNSELFLGSLNASHNASYRNIEFMFKLYGKREYINVEKLQEDLFGKEETENPFELVEIILRKKPEESVSDNLEKLIKEICRIKSVAKIIEAEDRYSLEINFKNLESSKGISICPLLLDKEKKQNLSERILFENLKIDKLSEFYIVSASSGDHSVERVIKIKTENMPQARISTVVNNIIKDKNGFVEYLSFILGDDYLFSMIENSQASGNGLWSSSGEIIPAIYEKMLKAAVHSKNKLKEIKGLIDLITDKNLIPDNFEELYRVFEKAIDNNEK